MDEPAARLPEAFADLEPWLAEWCLASEHERLAKLVATSIEDLRPFYDAVAPRAEAMIEHLDHLSPAHMPERDRNLFHLLMTFVETSHPIELGWTITDIDEPFPLSRIEFVEPSATSPVAIEPEKIGDSLLISPTRLSFE